MLLTKINANSGYKLSVKRPISVLLKKARFADTRIT